LSRDGIPFRFRARQSITITDPDHVQRLVDMEEQYMHKDYVEGRLPGISDRYRAAVSCLYTTTPDSNFVIEVHPDNDRIMITSPCSGHGFKHSAAIGEALAEKVIYGNSQIDISSFSTKRFNDLIQ